MGHKGEYSMPGSATVKYGGNTTCFELNCGEIVESLLMRELNPFAWKEDYDGGE